MFRVAITGSHSVGKTTLAKNLCENLRVSGYTCELIPELFKSIEHGLSRLYEHNKFVQIIKTYLKDLECLPKCDYYIFDRTLFDIYVYYKIEGSQDIAFKSYIRELAKWYTRTIDLFVYIPIEIPLVHDNYRPKSNNYRATIDDEIKKCALEFGLSMAVASGTLQQRTTKILRLISGLPTLSRLCGKFDHELYENIFQDRYSSEILKGGLDMGFTIEVEKRVKDENFSYRDLKLYHKECYGGEIENGKYMGRSYTCKRCGEDFVPSNDDWRLILVKTAIDGEERKIMGSDRTGESSIEIVVIQKSDS